eukprot:2914893-Rhodomonas_salina.4
MGSFKTSHYASTMLSDTSLRRKCNAGCYPLDRTPYRRMPDTIGCYSHSCYVPCCCRWLPNTENSIQQDQDALRICAMCQIPCCWRWLPDIDMISDIDSSPGSLVPYPRS